MQITLPGCGEVILSLDVDRRMLAWVELINHLDAETWPARNTAGEVPNNTPFGIDELGRYDVDVRFRPILAGRVSTRVARLVRQGFEGIELVEAIAAYPRNARRQADVVLCWDEFTGIPAALLSRLPGSPPVVAGVQLLTDSAGRSPGFLRLAQAAMCRFNAVFVQSQGMIPVLRDQWGVSDSRLHFVPFGIDATWFQPLLGDIDRNLVASVGDDSHRDHETLVKAVTAVQARRPGTRLELATELSVQLPPEIGVLHRGHLGSRRRQFYGQAAITAVATHPNVHGSGLSVVLETMACGRPYVVTASLGLEGYLRHNEDGLVVPPGDIDALADAIAALLHDPERADAMGAAGRARLERQLTTDVQARHLAAVIQEVVKRG